jgi:hypothetical protein
LTGRCTLQAPERRRNARPGLVLDTARFSDE